MRFSNWSPEQFLDSNSLNALTSNVSGDFNTVGRSFAKPGLLYPELATFTASGLSINSTLPGPFGVCFASGTVAHAHGNTTGLDTTAYTTSFAGVVPASGSPVTAYLLASLSQILENPFTNIGPPVGHPDFNPNFVPSTAYGATLDTLLLTASTTPPDNLTTFELGRATLAVGATGMVFSTAFQNRVSAPNTTQVVQVSGNTTLSIQPHAGHLVQAIAAAVLTLPAASGSNGTVYGVASQTSGAVTLQTQGSDLIYGFGTNSASGITSFALPSSAAAFVHCEDGIWQIIGGSAGGIGATNPAVGQCRLVVAAATTLTLSPYQGNGLTIHGQNQSIPGAGVSITTGGLSASTLYYVYAFLSGASIALELSATGYATDTSTPGNIGVAIKSGDATRTLVGLVRTNASTQFVDNLAQRFCLSYFNSQPKNTFNGASTIVFNAAVLTEVSTSLRVEFLVFGGQQVFGVIDGYYSNNAATSQTFLQSSFDGSATGTLVVTYAPANGASAGFSSQNISSFLSEGYHYQTVLGEVIGGVGTINQYYNRMTVQG